MPEARDRLSRSIDIAAAFARTRSLLVYHDQPEIESALFGSPVSRQTTATQRTVFGAGVYGSGRGSPIGRFNSRVRGSARVRGRYLNRSPAPGRENVQPFGSARRGRNSVLPSWYPRTPFRDITAIVRAIERRRERLGGLDGHEIGSPTPQQLGVFDSSERESVGDLEHGDEFQTPGPSTSVKPRPTVGKVSKILRDATNQDSSGDSELVTPQKKLLDSIDTVEKEVMEEIRKLKRTPTAKRAEREKKVRTLMSLR